MAGFAHTSSKSALIYNERDIVIDKFDPKDFLFRRFDSETDVALLDDITTLLHAAYRPLLEDGLRYVATHQTSDITLRRLIAGEGYIGFLGARLMATITLVTDIRGDDCDWFMRPGVFKFAQFGVHPEDQGQGVGQHIMQLIEARARELGAKELSLDTSEKAHQLIAMYTKLGYRQVDTVDWDATNYKSVVLSKTL